MNDFKQYIDTGSFASEEDISAISSSLDQLTIDYSSLSGSLDDLWIDYNTTSGSIDNLSSSLDGTIENLDTNYYTKIESDAQDINRNAGLKSTPTYATGSGILTIDPVTITFYTSSDFSGHPATFTIDETTLNPTDNTKAYVVADYNDNDPILRITETVAEINESTILPVLTIYRQGTEIYCLGWDQMGKGLPNKIHQRLVKTSRFVRETGVMLSEDATRKIHISEGKVWYGATYALPSEFVSGDPGTETYLHYHSGSSWTAVPITQYNNTQYDNGTGLVALDGVNRYAVNWVYRSLAENCNRTCVVLGSGNYTLNQALDSSLVADVPSAITSLSMLVGRIIVKNNINTAYTIQNTVDTTFTQAIISNHEDMTGLLGGTTDQHYHFTQNEYDYFQDVSGSYYIPSWDDLVILATGVNPPGAIGPPSYNVTDATLDFVGNGDNRVDLNFQLPHSYMTGSAADFHIHYKCSTTGTGNVRWNIKYRWYSINGVIPAYSDTTITMPIPTPGASNKHYTAEMLGTGSLTGANQGISSIMQVQLTRMAGTDGDDTYTGNIQAISFDMHIQKDTIGSYYQWIKRP